MRKSTSVVASRSAAVLAAFAIVTPTAVGAQSGAIVSAGQTAGVVIPAIEGKLRTLRFYEIGDEPVAAEDRAYAAKFEKARTRRIGSELTFDFPARGQVASFSVECHYTLSDSTLNALEIPFEVQAEWTSVRNATSWGWSAPGNWQPGTYHVSCTSDGAGVAEGEFQIVDGPPDLPSFDAKLSRMRVFAGSSSMPTREERVYATRFAAADVQYINVEIELKHPAPGRVVHVPINCLIIRDDGAIAATIDLSFNGIEAGWTSAARAAGWGSATAGSFWTPGKYRVACSGDGNLIGQLVFEVT